MPLRDRDDSFCISILHDIGKLIMAINMRREFDLVLEQVRATNRAMCDIEREMLGFTHADVGAYLLSLWGFSKSSTNAICWHHSPEKLSFETISTEAAVMLANSLEHELMDIHPNYAAHSLVLDETHPPGLSKRMETWREVCRQCFQGGEKHV